MIFGHLSKLFHKKTTGLLAPGIIPADSRLWPKEWVTVEYKTYPRMDRVALSAPTPFSNTYENMLRTRASLRDFDPAKSLTHKEVSTLLYWTVGEANFSNALDNDRNRRSAQKRFYPSGGGRYPVETYISIRNSREIASGVYHYNIKEHSLERLLGPEGDLLVKNALTYPWSKDAPFVLMFTAVWNRNFMKYRDFGYRIVLLETGHVAQNAVISATGLGLGCCTLAGFRTEEMAKILDIDMMIEAPTYVIAMGHPKMG